jgi:hypothetical protein
MKACVLVLGMHRSGTSAITGALEKIGVALPQDLLPANEFNERGYFEGEKVMLLNDQILSEMGSSWDDTQFQTTLAKEIIEKFLSEVKQFIEKEFAYSKVFALKDPRMCITFPVWERALNELAIDIKVVFPYRNPFEIARSLKQRNDFSVEKSLLLWAKHLLTAERYSRAYPRYFLGFNQFLKNVPEHLKNIAEFLGIDAEQAAIEDVQNNFIEASIKHHNLNSKNVAENMPLFIKHLLKLVQNDSLAFAKAEDWEDIFQEVGAIFQFMQAQDVQLQTQVCSDLQIQQNQTKHRVEVLEKIKDITYVDADYYKAKYSDIAQHDIDSATHFMEYGKAEGRYPNACCELNQLDVKTISSATVILYLTQKQLTEKQAKLAQLEQSHAKQSEQSQAQIEALQTEKAGLVEKQDQLNQELESLLKDLETVKEAKQNQKDELHSQIDALNSEKQTLTEQTLTLEQQLEEQAQANGQALQDKNNQLQTVQAQLAQLEQSHAKQSEQSQAQIEALQSGKAGLVETKEKLTQEIQQLSESIDHVVTDLACIKESKCWIYTKPIRDLNKVFKK